MTIRCARVVAVTAALTFLLGSSAPVAAGHKADKMDRALKAAVEKDPGTPKRVIVQTTKGTRSSVSKKLESRGGRLMAEHAVIDAVSAEVSVEDLKALADDADVLSLSMDLTVYAQGRRTPRKAIKDQGRRRTQPAESDPRLDSGMGAVLPYGGLFDGAGIGIAVIDSGVAERDGLKGRVVASYDFTGPRPVRGKAADAYGHGTYVAGLIAGDGSSTGGEVRGVAPAARIYSFRVLDAEGTGQTSDVIEAIEFAITNREALGIDILNLSLGHPIEESYRTDPLVRAVEHASQVGLVVVVSAGNFGKNQDTGVVGYAGITSPGNAPSAITVGAAKTFATVTLADDLVADFSSRGPTYFDGRIKPELVAPGHRLVTETETGSYIYRNFPDVRTVAANGLPLMKMSGTSGAAAVVSGVVARMLEAHRAMNPLAPGLTANAVKAMLQYSAIRLHDPLRISSADPSYDVLTQGAGLVNAQGAIALAWEFDLAANENPFALFGDAPVSSVGSETWEWGQRIIWGETDLWGQRIIWGEALDCVECVGGQRIIWGETFLSALSSTLRWGTTFDSSPDSGYTDDELEEPTDGTGYIVDGIIWGGNIVWGNNIVWGENIVWGDGCLTTPDGQPLDVLSQPQTIKWNSLSGGQMPLAGRGLLIF